MRAAEEAEAFFNARRFRLRTRRDGDRWWADLVSDESGFEAVKYGVGDTPEAAMTAAKRRWEVEEEPPGPPPRRLP